MIAKKFASQQPDHLIEAQQALDDFHDSSTDYAEARSLAYVATAHALVDIAATMRRIADHTDLRARIEYGVER